MGLDDPTSAGGDAPTELQERVSPDEGVVYDRFSPRVVEKLGRYVYRLVDPRDGETFYVGRGVGNRVFDHMDEAKDAFFLGGGSDKTDRINEIHRAGMRVQTVIHRHALRDDAETAVVEAVLIQAYPKLTNQVAGTGTRAFGARPTNKAIDDYDLPPADLDERKGVLLSLSARWPKVYDDAPTSWSAIYTMARHGWTIDVKRAQKAEVVVCHAHGIIVAVFVADAWLPASDPVFLPFPRPEDPRAYGFVGRPARARLWREWVGRRIPDKYRTRFGQRIRYVRV